jgi:hypothetical protein
MGAVGKYVAILLAERSTLVGFIMVVGGMIGWETSHETATRIEELLLLIIQVVGTANMLLPDDLRKLLGIAE